MSNITRNMLLALTLVCVIALIVFCIQLIVINRGIEPADSGAVISGGSQSNDGDDADGDDPTGDDFSDLFANSPRPPPLGTRRDLLVSENTRLVIFASEELFEYEEGDLDWFFRYTGEGAAELEIRFMAITQQGVAENAESFLNSYSGSGSAEFTGEQSIHGSPVSGYHVSAMAGGEMYEAWIVDLDNSDVALVLVIKYQNEQQKEALSRVLSSLEME